MAGIFGGGDPYAGSGQAAYNQQQPSFPGYDYPNDYPMTGLDYGGGGGGDYGGYTSYGGGMGSPTDPGAGYYDTGGGGTAASGGGGILDWLGSEKGQRALQQLGGFSAGMLQGSSPSLQPRNFYTGLGAGMEGMQKAGSQYYDDALKRSQAALSAAKVGDLQTWSQIMQGAAANATGLPPGYGMPGAGTTGTSMPAATPAAAGAGGDGGGGFAAVEPHIFQYENRTRNPYIGTGGADLSKAPLSETGFPQWAGISTPQGRSTAAGLYQITQSTWNDYAPKLGIKDFSPESQRRIAEALYNDRGLQPWLVGNPAFRNAVARGLVSGQAGSAAMAGGNISAPLRDTAFQMPANMAAGLGGPGGILPQAAPAPGATQPQPSPLSSALRPPVAPVATLPSGAPVAAAPLLAAAPPAAESPPTTSTSAPAVIFEGAGNVANINRNVENNPNHYRDKVVVLTPVGAGAKLDKLPDQIASVKEAGGQPVLQAGDNAKQNARMAQIAAKEGVPYRGLSGNDSGAGGGGPSGAEIAPVPVNPEPLASGAVPGAVPGLVARPAPVPPVTQPPAAPGSLAPGGALQLPPGGAPAGAGPVLAQGTAPGMPAPPAPPSSAPPAPPPGAAVAPPGPPPPPVPGAVAGAPPGAMPGAIAPPTVAAPPLPLAVPNLGQVQPPGAAGLPPYDVEAARRAQVLSIAGAATGHQVPAYLAEQAGLPTKALEQQWAMQKEMYGQQLGAARDQWKAMSDLQKEQYAAQNGLQKSQVESDLRMREELFKKGQMIGPNGQIMNLPGSVPAEVERSGAVAQAQKNAEALAEFDRSREYKVTDNAGKPSTIIATPRQMGATPPSALGAAPAPGGTQAPGTPGAVGGYQSGIAPGREAELTGEGKRLAEVATQVHSEAQTAVNSRADLEFLSALGPNISAPGPWASAMQSFNRVRQSVLGTAAEPVASYELAQQLMGGMMRTALRASDPNPTERQQAMMLASMPTPASSAEGFQEGIRHMQGLADYKVFKQQALINWQRDHDGSAAGFEGSFKLSAIPFVLDRMSDTQQTAYISKLQAKDPKALDRLRDQVEAVKNLNYTYKY